MNILVLNAGSSSFKASLYRLTEKDLPEVDYVYPVPYQWLERGIRKYGFHGISHQYCTQQAAKLAFLGLEIDPALNSLPMTLDRNLAIDRSQVSILTIHTQEEWQIATICSEW